MTKSSVYDTRFFFEYFFSDDQAAITALKQNLRTTAEKMVSAVTIYELHKLNLKRLDRETANLRSTLISREFKVISVDYGLAVSSAEVSNRHKIPLADSVVAATAIRAGCPLVSDDDHFKSIHGLEILWPLT